MTIVTDAVDDWMDPVLRTFSGTLGADVEGHAVTAYLQGQSEVVSWGRTVIKGLPRTFEGPPISQAIDYAKKRGALLIKGMEEETKRRLATVVSDGIKNKRGIDGLARDLRNTFEDMAKDRSKTIARSETSDALQQAFMDTSADMGVTGKEWIEIAPLDEDCLMNAAAGVIPINEDFPSGHARPPAHPNAVFADSPFFSYGRLLQVVRSRYSGSARAIQTDRVSFTIGPNHPILTRRGWVKASEIHEGDQLIYDVRIEDSGVAVVETYFDKMPTIQDAFDALVFAFGKATVASPRAYFHGDEVFAYGEVDVVLPTTDLLSVLDARGIEKLRKDFFMRADSELPLVASGSPGFNAPNRISLAPPSNMGSLELMDPLPGSCVLPPHFKFCTVTHIETSHYSGWAYDASTSSTVYNSSGIVVKNCVCALAPVMI